MENHIPLPPSYAVPLGVLSSVSAILSIAGSSCILRLARRDFFSQMQQRLMIYVSLSDIGLSLTVLLMPYALPPGMGYDYVASGTADTCTAFGFFLGTFVWTGGCYNCYLSLYFLATIRYQWKENTRSNRRCKIPLWEIGIHLLTLMVVWLGAGIAAAKDLIHPNTFFPMCYLGANPYACDEGDQVCEEAVSAGYKLVTGLKGMAYSTFVVVTCISYWSTFMLYWTVRQKMRRSSHFRFSAEAHDDPGSLDASRMSQSRISHTSHSRTDATASAPSGDDPFQKRVLQVRTQATLYALVYFNSVIWFVLFGALVGIIDPTELQEKKATPGLYTLQILGAMFGPLQGFLNFLVYIRPKVMRWRAVRPDKSLLWIGKQILAEKQIPRSSAVVSSGRKQLKARVRLQDESRTSRTAGSSTFRESIANLEAGHGDMPCVEDPPQLDSNGDSCSPFPEPLSCLEASSPLGQSQTRDSRTADASTCRTTPTNHDALACPPDADTSLAEDFLNEEPSALTIP